jgi:dolichyl-phosphate beta-glucosyltransferase
MSATLHARAADRFPEELGPRTPPPASGRKPLRSVPLDPAADVSHRPAVDLEIVIPAFNEARRLPSTLRHTMGFLRSQPWSTRVVVVDNGSSDDTPGVVRMVADELDGEVDVSVIGCARPGKGAAVRRGLLSSRSRFVGFFDADLATPVATLTSVMEELQRGTTAVIGSRHAVGATMVRPQARGRRLGGAAFRLLAHTMVTDVRDTQCGFKFFERLAVTHALVQCRSTGFAFDVELLRRIQDNGGRIVELPVAWSDGATSTFHPWRDGIASFSAVLQMHRLAY